jgi:hypothetical protein
MKTLARRSVLLASSAALLLAAPGLACAEPFHMAHADFDLTEGHVDVVSDLKARAEPDGERSILVTRVVLTLGDPDARGSAIKPSLDQTRFAFDCKAGTYRTVSQAHAAGLDPEAAQADAGPTSAGEAKPVADDEMQDFEQFACTGPRSLTRKMFGFQEQNLAEALARAADELSRTLTKLMQSVPRS